MAAPLPDDHATLLARVAPRGLSIAARLVGTADAEDAVQEALVRTIVTNARDPEAWFIRVLVNHCIGIQRRQRLGRTLFGWLDLQPTPPRTDEQLDAARLRKTVERLPAMQRTVVQLRYGEELSVADIAELLGVGGETVKTHLQRALHRLRELMGERS